MRVGCAGDAPGADESRVEIAPEVADGEFAVITDQVTNGLAVRMALLYLLLGGGAMSLLLKNGRIIDPSQGIDKVGDLLIEMADRWDRSQGRERGADHRLHRPCDSASLIDMHVHLREPGFEHKETIRNWCEGCGGGRFHNYRRNAQHQARDRQPSGCRVRVELRASALT